MELSIPVTRSDAHRLRDPASVVWIGVAIPNDQTPERAEAVRDALVEPGAELASLSCTRTTRCSGSRMTVIGPRHVGGRESCGRHGADRGRPRPRRRTRRVRVLRRPGQHVTRSAFGGSCYLNNAAVAAQP